MTARDDKRGAYVPLTRETIEIMRAGFHCFAVDQEQKVRLSTLCEMALQSLTYGSALSHVEQITQAAGESADVAGHMATPASGMESSQGGGKPPSTPSTTPQKTNDLQQLIYLVEPIVERGDFLMLQPRDAKTALDAMRSALSATRRTEAEQLIRDLKVELTIILNGKSDNIGNTHPLVVKAGEYLRRADGGKETNG